MGTGPAAKQHKKGRGGIAGSSPAGIESSEHALQHHGNYRDNGYLVLIYGVIDDKRIKFFMYHHADPIDDTAHQNREATYLEERQAGKPTILKPMPKIETP